MNYIISCLGGLFTATLCYLLVAIIKPRRDPPGPRPLPLLGNVLDFPQHKPWETFAKWQEQYGDIIFMDLLGIRMIILNSLDTCADLLEKRSAKYSGRPRAVMLTELMGFDYSIALMDYSPRWRNYRRLFHQSFSENESITHRPIQEKYVYVFLQRLLAEPEKFFSHTRLLFGETILDVVYDIKMEDNNSIFIQLAEKAATVSLAAGIPGQFLVDLFPPLKYIPSWFPGAKFKRLAREWKRVAVDLKDLPFAYAKKKMEEGRASPSVITSMLEKCKKNSEPSTETKKGEKSSEEMVKECAALAYLAGADTTLSTIQTFFMMMANHQDVQQAAQKELDTLLGDNPTRLPNFGDKDRLPFVTAITKEMLRWHNVVPMSAPHALTEDDEYNGYILRKGTIVFPNVWHILRDPRVYPDPLTFNPKRWLIDTPDGQKLNPDVPDPIATFGFGRRICPGQYFASNSLFITVATVLACFNIKPLNADGQPEDHVEESFTSGLLIYPIPYKVAITPRSNTWTQLIKELET